MTEIVKCEAKIRRASHQRPKSLILSISPTIRDIMNFEHGTPVILEVCLDENDKKFVKISKKD